MSAEKTEGEKILIEMSDSGLLQCDGRREKCKGECAQSDRYSLTCLQVAETRLSLRPSRLCGLLSLRSTAWIELNPKRGMNENGLTQASANSTARAALGCIMDVAGLLQLCTYGVPILYLWCTYRVRILYIWCT